MFENIIELTARKVVDLFDKNDFPISLNGILSHPLVGEEYKSYISAEVDWWIYEDMVRKGYTGDLDMANPEVKQVMDDLDVQYNFISKFGLEDLRILIDSVVKSRINFLCRPRFTLQQFAFRGQPVKPIDEIIKRMKYFSDYPYFADGFMEWLSAGGDDGQSEEFMAAGRFGNLISRIDREYIFNLSPSEFAHLLDPLFSFFIKINSNSEVDDKCIPMEALIIFLDDKDILALARTLEKERNSGMARISQQQFIDIIQDFVESIEKTSDEPLGTAEPEEASTDAGELIEDEVSAEATRADLAENSGNEDSGNANDEFLISLNEMAGALENSRQSDKFDSIEEYSQSAEIKDSDNEFILSVQSELEGFANDVIEFNEIIAGKEEFDNISVSEELITTVETEIEADEEQEVETQSDDIRKNINVIEEIIGISGYDEENDEGPAAEITDDLEQETEIPIIAIEFYEKVFGLSEAMFEEGCDCTKADEILKAELADDLIEAPPDDK